MRTWCKNFKDKTECLPRNLNEDQILRWDNVIISNKQDILDMCSSCISQALCIQNLKDMKTDLYSKNRWWN